MKVSAKIVHEISTWIKLFTQIKCKSEATSGYQLLNYSIKIITLRANIEQN